MAKKPILCIDFDGVIHSYSSGWKGARNIPDPPVKGAIKFLLEATKYFEVNIFSSRSRYWGARPAMKRWLRREIEKCIATEAPEFIEQDPFNEDQSMAAALSKSHITDFKFPVKKPPAFLTLDDRAINFGGVFPAPEDLLNFKPWNKKQV